MQLVQSLATLQSDTFANAITSLSLVTIPLPFNILCVQIGKKIWQKFDFADGRPSLTIKNDFWDFNIQETIILKTPFTLKAGDTITSYCVYDSTQRTEPTM